MKNINKSTNKQIKIGIVGYGIRGQKMARLSINNFPEYEITAVCDKSKEMLIKAEQDFPEIKTYHNFDKMLNYSGINTLFVETPAPYHAYFSIEALKHNIHVLSDVPAVNDIAEARELWGAHLESSAVYMLQSTTNMFGYIQHVLDLQKQETLGQPYYIEAEYIHDLRELFGTTPWREKYENIKYCTHSLGPSLQILKEPLIQVSCFDTGSHVNKKPGQHDAMVAIFRTSSNAIVKLLVSFINYCPAHGQRYRFYFDNGYFERTADYEGEHSGTSYFYSDSHHIKKELNDIKIGEGLLKNQHLDSIGNHGGANYELLKQFYKRINTGKKSPLGLKEALLMSIPGIFAAESARKDGKNIDIQYPWN